MKDMTELERRIAAALDRIATHAGSLYPARPEPEPAAEVDDGLPPAADLLAELEAERDVTAQLEERVRAIKERQDTKVSALETDLAAARDRIAALEEENTGLRDAPPATAQGADDTGALRSELEALRATRAAERDEIDALLAELKPIVEESAGA